MFTAHMMIERLCTTVLQSPWLYTWISILLVEWLGVVSNIGKKVAMLFTTIYMQLVCRYTIDRYQFKHGCMRKASNNDLLQ